MTLRNLILQMILALLAGSAAGQTTTLEGRLTLKEEPVPVPGIHVYLEHTEFGTYTGTKGAFRLEGIPAGEYILIASAIGFHTLKVPVDLRGTPVAPLALEMEESVMGLPVAVVQSVSMTGGLRGLRDVPGSAQYLSPRELRRFGHTDINRVLRSVPGVNLQEEDGFGLRPNIGLRGTGAERSSKITLMEDGVLAAPAPYAAPAAYYFPTIGRMQGIEILKGSSQVRFGPFTTGGAINLLSTTIPDEFSGRLDLLGGSYGSRNLHAFAGNSHTHFGYLVETFQYRADGFKVLDGGGDTGFDKKDYLVKFRVNTGPKAKIAQSLTFKAGQSDEISHETYLGLTAADFGETPFRRYAASQMDRMDAQQRQYSLRHIVQFTRSFDITTTVYRHDFHRNWYKLDKVNGEGISGVLEDPEAHAETYEIMTGASSAGGDALQVKANNRNYMAQGVQTVAGLRFGTGRITHYLDLGLRYHYDEMDRFQWTDQYRMEAGVMQLTQAGTPGTESNRILSARALAAYAQYKIKAGRWTLIPGLRFEDIALEEKDYGKADPERQGGQLKESSNRVQVAIPGVGADFRLSQAVHLFGGVHKGFSPPGAAEGTAPEESVNYELGSRLQQGGWSGQVVLFYNDYENLLGADLAAAGGSGSGDVFNGGEARAMGLEVQGGFSLLARLPVTLAYTFTDAVFLNPFDSDFEGWGAVEAGDQIPYLARHQLSLGLSWEGEKWELHLNGRFQSAMHTQAGQGRPEEDQRADAFSIVDLSGTYWLHRNFSLFGSVANLWNETYVVARHPAGLRPAMPRNFMVGGRVRF